MSNIREQYRLQLNKLGGQAYNDKTAEIIAALGETNNVNDCGVYTNCEEEKLPSKHLVRLEAAKGSDGMWRYGYGYRGPTSGLGAPCSIIGKGYGSKESALKAAAQEILNHSCEMPKDVEKILTDYINSKEQLSLF